MTSSLKNLVRSVSVQKMVALCYGKYETIWIWKFFFRIDMYCPSSMWIRKDQVHEFSLGKGLIPVSGNVILLEAFPCWRRSRTNGIWFCSLETHAFMTLCTQSLIIALVSGVILINYLAFFCPTLSTGKEPFLVQLCFELLLFFLHGFFGCMLAKLVNNGPFWTTLRLTFIILLLNSLFYK